MQLARPGIALDPRRFGRAGVHVCDIPERTGPLNDDLRLFLTSFAAGFLFVSLLIA